MNYAFSQRVKHYYDRNTRLFLGHESALCSAVHRGVWAPGVVTREQAFGYVNQLILEVAQQTGKKNLRVIDLGCGVGGTLMHLARSLPIEGVGVAISPVQVESARELARRADLQANCRFIEANYLELPELPPFGLAYAVESFVHGPDPERFFESTASILDSGGRLVLCDDLLTVRGAGMEHTNTRAGRWLHDFRRGWQVGSLVTFDWAVRTAARFGLELVGQLDLTPHLRLRTRWDRWISLCVELFGWLPYSSPWWDSWVGGHGVQMSLATGLVEYRWLEFVKR